MIHKKLIISSSHVQKTKQWQDNQPRAGDGRRVGVLVHVNVVLIEEVLDVHDGEVRLVVFIIISHGEADGLAPESGAEESGLRVRVGKLVGATGLKKKIN